MSTQTIYTEQNNCQDCYKCIRHCPVKAIKIEDHRASVVQELCIYCGKCVDVCPAGAKKVRDDLSA
ncbi:MAG TPA: 4Fe-4S binding protein, partial [Bacteroidales bacterium]|nr:4Fe-4S binding protein [Bacteroidales bacterium]